jgi:hypothetical protein
VVNKKKKRINVIKKNCFFIGPPLFFKYIFILDYKT